MLSALLSSSSLRQRRSGYAILGVQTGTSIVDITDAPTVNEVGFVQGSTSLWRELKVYRAFAYVVNESGCGIQIIDLSVYTALGEKLRELINGFLEAGIHRVTRSGDDDRTHDVDRGVYFFRLVTPTTSERGRWCLSSK